jgi:hypothetical protein
VGGLEIRSGTLTTSVTWSLTGIVYVLTGDVTVTNGAALTIGPGTIVKFSSSTGLTVGGTLTVNGTAGNKVYFTSLADDTIGGDTNGDGGNTTPYRGYWDRIYFNAGSGTVTYADVRYAGSSFPNYAGILVEDASPTISNCEVLLINGSGIFISANSQQTRPTITYCSVHDNPTGVRITGTAATPIIQNNNIYKNSSYGVFNATSWHWITASYNWWGATTGPYDPSSSGTDGDYNDSGNGGSGQRLRNVSAFWYQVLSVVHRPLQAGITPIKAVHIAELHSRIDSLRTRYGLGAFAWTDPTLAAGTTIIRAQHIIDLRTALREV